MALGIAERTKDSLNSTGQRLGHHRRRCSRLHRPRRPRAMGVSDLASRQAKASPSAPRTDCLAAMPGLLPEEVQTLHPQRRGGGILVPQRVLDQSYRGVCRRLEETCPPRGGAHNSLKRKIVGAHRQSSNRISRHKTALFTGALKRKRRAQIHSSEAHFFPCKEEGETVCVL